MKYALIASLLLVVGCAQAPKFDDAKARLPNDSTNIRKLEGGGYGSWYTFDLVIDGKKRTFLYRCHVSNYGDMLTEIGANDK